MKNRPGRDAALAAVLGFLGLALPLAGCGRISAGGGAATLPPPGLSATSTPVIDFDGRWLILSGHREDLTGARLWAVRKDGSGLREITAGQGDPADPAWLPDGRIIYSDIPAGDAGSGSRSLFSCAADGSDIRRVTWSPTRDDRPALLPDGRVRFERRPLDAAPGAASLRMAVHPDGTGVSFDAGAQLPITGAPDRPPRRPPILTSVVRADRATGTLLCLDVRRSRLAAVAAAPPGAIARVRVDRLTTGGEPQRLGEAPVHPDGSFLIEVPADTPLRLTLLRADGGAFAALASGLWVRPNENRGCIGCHEEPQRSPENRQPLAVRQAPVKLARSQPPSPADSPGGADGP